MLLRECSCADAVFVGLHQWRVAGSRVIVSDSCVAWDFRLSEADWAVAQAKFLAQKLSESFESPLVKVSRRAHQVDVMLRNFGIGTALYELIRVINDAGPWLPAAISSCCSLFHGVTAPEFVLAIGNDTNDEEMFKTLQDLLERGSEVTPLGFPGGAVSCACVIPSRCFTAVISCCFCSGNAVFLCDEPFCVRVERPKAA